MPESSKPNNVLEHAADCGLTATLGRLHAAGATPEQVLILVHAHGQPDGEPNSTIAGHGYADGRELLAGLLSHAISIASAIGLQLNVIPEVVP